MQNLSKYNLITFSGLIFGTYTYASYWIYQHTHSPIGNSLYFLGIAICIFFYIFKYFILINILRKNPNQINLLPAILIFKLTELNFYLITTSFILISHFLIMLIIGLKILLLCATAILYRQQKKFQGMLPPFYDLVLLFILAAFLAYAPDIYKHYKILSIGMIDLAINLVLIVIILFLTFLNYQIYQTILKSQKS